MRAIITPGVIPMGVTMDILALLMLPLMLLAGFGLDALTNDDDEGADDDR